MPACQISWPQSNYSLHMHAHPHPRPLDQSLTEQLLNKNSARGIINRQASFLYQMWWPEGRAL